MYNYVDEVVNVVVFVDDAVATEFGLKLDNPKPGLTATDDLYG